MAADAEKVFEMLYCPKTWCRVNTFERGPSGACPGCGAKGKVVHAEGTRL